MSKYSTLKAEIIASIKRNGAQAITGDLLQEKLLSMIDSLGEHYQFGGLALPSTEFTAGDEPVVFIAATPGTYTDFGGLVVADGEVALLVWDGSTWSKQTTDIATRTEVSQLGQFAWINRNIDSTILAWFDENIDSLLLYDANNDARVYYVTYITLNHSAIGGENYLGFQISVEDSAGNNIIYLNYALLANNLQPNSTYTAEVQGGTYPIVLYIRTAKQYSWESGTYLSGVKCIKFTSNGLGRNVFPFLSPLADRVERGFSEIKNENKTFISNDTISGIIQDVYVIGDLPLNKNKYLKIVYIGINHSAYGGSNTLGFNISYNDGTSETAFIISNANTLNPGQLVQKAGKIGQVDVSVIIRISDNFSWPADSNLYVLNWPILTNGYIKSILPTFLASKKYIDDNLPESEKWNIINVNPNGGGDFTTLRAALESITDASRTNKYKVILAPGTYELTDEYSENEITASSFLGYWIPDYTMLCKEPLVDGDVVISCELSVAVSSTVRDTETVGYYVSTINCRNTAWLEGITITAKNCRYPIHDDFATQDLERVMRDCKIIMYPKDAGASTLYHAYGGGCHGGGDYYYENCEFITFEGYAYLMHSNINFSKTSSLKFKNCIFATHSNFGNVFDVSIQSLGTELTQKCTAWFENCNFSCRGLGVEGTAWDWEVSGVGNTLAPIYVMSTEVLEEHYVSQVDETVKYGAFTAISQFQPVRFVNNANVSPMTNEPLNSFKGVALNSAQAGGTVIVKFRGYLHYSELGLSSISYGDKVKVNSDGTFGITTGDDWIGYCDKTDFVRLRENLI